MLLLALFIYGLKKCLLQRTLGTNSLHSGEISRLKSPILKWGIAYHTAVSKIIGPPEISSLDPIVNKSCNIERCGNKMHENVPNMMLSQYLQVKLDML